MKNEGIPCTTPVPLLGICDAAMHRLRPIVVAETKSSGREEFDILMVCSRCGYTRDARQLQQASEQLASDVMAEADRLAEKEIADNPGAETCDDEDQGDASGDRPRKKIN